MTHKASLDRPVARLWGGQWGGKEMTQSLWVTGQSITPFTLTNGIRGALQRLGSAKP